MRAAVFSPCNNSLQWVRLLYWLALGGRLPPPAQLPG